MRTNLAEQGLYGAVMATPQVSFETARLALARLNFDGDTERNAAMVRAARICSSALEVERVGVWLLQADAHQLFCPNVFVRSEDRCRAGETIALDAVPAYREALTSRKVVVAHDARSAPATRELTDFYLRPLGITSMLDAPVFREGEVVGVVCLEHVGPSRVWSDAECNFASSVADMLGMVLEQTARRAAESALRDRIADEADQHRHALIGQIAAGLAHDFGNVMQGIVAVAADLPGAINAERTQLQEDLATLASAGTDLVRQLRTFTAASRLGDRCDVREALAQLETILALICKGTAEVLLDLPPGPAWAPITRSALERVVLNLVLNARDAIRGFGHISLHLQARGDQLAIEVRDDGQGISQDLMVQVFQPYFTTRPQGTGLGLATVRALVEGAGGHITVTSKPGQGTCFTVALPGVAPPAAALPRG
jgi:two-component system, cell cycle sensor histidine kinase and response regulator CckA